MPGAGLRGAIVWAVVPYVPEAPFRLWLGTDQPIAEIPDVRGFAQQVKDQGLEAEQDFVVRAKLRPVVLMQDRPRGVLKEIVALRMVRLEKLGSAAQERIRGQLEPSLFHLRVHRERYGLDREVAIDLNALVRVHASAFLPRAVGRLDDDEMRVIGQRLAEHLDIDLEPLIAASVEERLGALTQEGE